MNQGLVGRPVMNFSVLVAKKTFFVLPIGQFPTFGSSDTDFLNGTNVLPIREF
jgi:hypothetical protein